MKEIERIKHNDTVIRLVKAQNQYGGICDTCYFKDVACHKVENITNKCCDADAQYGAAHHWELKK